MFGKSLRQFLILLVLVGLILLVVLALFLYVDSKAGVTYSNTSNGPTMEPFEIIGVFEVSTKENKTCYFGWEQVEITIKTKFYNQDGDLVEEMPEEKFSFVGYEILGAMQKGEISTADLYWEQYGGFDVTLFELADQNFYEEWICIITENQRIPDIPFK